MTTFDFGPRAQIDHRPVTGSEIQAFYRLLSTLETTCGSLYEVMGKPRRMAAYLRDRGKPRQFTDGNIFFSFYRVRNHIYLDIFRVSKDPMIKIKFEKPEHWREGEHKVGVVFTVVKALGEYEEIVELANDMSASWPQAKKV